MNADSTATTHKQCDPGFYNGNSDVVSACAECGDGYVQPALGATECTTHQCEAGTYDEQDDVHCYVRTCGERDNEVGVTNVDDACTDRGGVWDADVGCTFESITVEATFDGTEGAVWNDVQTCVDCPADWFQASPAQTLCVLCPDGWKTDEADTGSTE